MAKFEKGRAAAKSGWAWSQLVILPIVAAMGIATAVIGLMGPATVATIVDSGERWYNPFSWSLDESAAISVATANQAAIAAHTQLLWAMGLATAAAVLAAVMVLGRAIQPEARHQSLRRSQASPSAPAKAPAKAPTKAPAHVMSQGIPAPDVSYPTRTSADELLADGQLAGFRELEPEEEEAAR